MANVWFTNFSLNANNDLFSAVWKLTRAMKKAGWVYKSSGDGTGGGKDTTGVAANDKWGGNADPAADAYPSFGSVSAWWNAQGPSTLKIPITIGSVGTFIRGEDISQATTSAHGELLGYIFDTQAASTVISDGSVGQSLPQSTINVISTSGFLAAGTFLVTTLNGVQTITYTGITTSAFTGCSGGTGVLTNNAAVTQAQGYLVVAPRVDGTGGDPHGWDHVDTITGSKSGATVVPSATVIEYVREIVFWKDLTGAPNFTNGNIYYQCIDNNAENASRYSVLATSTGATGAQAPGGGGTNNGFPTAGSFTAIGTGGALTPSNRWTNHTAGGNQNKAQIIAVNATNSSKVSGDGSFTMAIGIPNVDSGSWNGIAFNRVDNQESGDVDPYVWYIPSQDTSYTQKVSTALTISAGDSTFTSGGTGISQGQSSMFRFWRRRGLSGEGFCQAVFSCLLIGQTGSNSTLLYAPNVGQAGGGEREQLACTFSTTYLTDDIWVISPVAANRMRKGTCRWLRVVGSGINATGTDTFGNKSWIALSSKSTIGNSLPFLAGPWDGVTTPVNT